MPAIPHVVGTAAKTAGASLGVVASLLTFPAHVPWMLAAWLGLFSLALWTRQSAGVVWFTLLAGPVVAAGKGTNPSPGLMLAAATVAVTALLLPVARRRIADPRKVALAAGLPLWISVGVMVWEWRGGVLASRTAELNSNDSVVCIGDSLTAPDGADGGYPEALAKLLPHRIVNLGQDGITTKDVLATLPRLREASPQIVVIELGGHDFLKGISRAEAKSNLAAIIISAREVGAAVILVEVPRGFIFDPWYGLEREIARELDLELVPDSVIRRFVLFSPHAPPGMWLPPDRLLSEDGLHPNRAGKQALAEAVAGAVRRMTKSSQ